MFAMLVSDIHHKSQSSIEADGYALRRCIDRQQLLQIATSLGPIKIYPSRRSAGLPIGLQIAAPSFGEVDLRAFAQTFEQETPWHKRTPSLFS